MVIILLGIIMYFIGLICKYLHDDYKQYPNIHAGYKIGSAMNNKETWEEANSYIYKACIISLIVSISFIGLTNLLDLKIPKLVYYIVEILILVGPIVLTEIHLDKFNKSRSENN
ncbi:SdpI family protein [Paraclostridium sordellii]|uniref:SdpI family protein n=1 Tax=Paraclostridium sordellii TaxID=1505 RepID=UPI00189AA563|nr:SdpI family protein [Paeniclostridium sordellii]MCR1848931.1 SdpI family protein [Paeniclostridium sordellii]